MKKPVKKPEYYVDNKKFYEEIVKYYDDCKLAEAAGKPRPTIPDYIGDCLLKIANRYVNHPWFANYSFREEMIGDAIENCILYFHNFDPTKWNNPFAYFTQITKFAFRRRILKEEKNRYIIYKNFESSMILGNTDALGDGEKGLISFSMYDNITEFMAKYEEKEREKKLKRIRDKELKNEKDKSRDNTVSD